MNALNPQADITPVLFSDPRIRLNGLLTMINNLYADISASDRVQIDTNKYKQTSYRDDIQGIRAIGAILIMIYHIWFSKVSGGVDVFFVVSGYFMAGMLARSYLRTGKVNPLLFWGRIIVRVAPLAYTVIATTLLVGLLLNPPSLWRSTINEVLTSALHVENWNLIRVGTDYLDSSNPPSPLQQFWALSLQIQLYILLPLILFVAIHLSKIFKTRNTFLAIVGIIIISSYGFSVHYTNIRPTAAYFHTATRAWEFFVGVAVFIGAPFISVSPMVSRLLGWIGLLLILAVGIIIPDTTKYPGYIATLPVAAAVMMITAGISSKPGNLYKVLSSKALVYIGGISFSLYLWHWPTLIYFQHYTGVGRGEMSFAGGLFVMTTAFVLAVMSKNVIENPFAKFKEKSIFVPFFIGLGFFIPVLGVSYYAREELMKVYDEAEKTDYVNGRYYGGESVNVQKGASGIDFKRLVTTKNDIPSASLNGCSAGPLKNGISSCEFGDRKSERTILLVGGSRVAHWEPLFSYIGTKNGFRVITATMDRCSFGYHPKLEGESNCQEWNKKIIPFISNIRPKPKVVIVNSSRLGDNGEFTPAGYVKNIKEVLALGIPVIGIRINPKFNNPDVCLWRHGSDASKCAAIASLSLKDQNTVLSSLKKEGLENFYPVDFTNAICHNDLCPAVFNGYPTMRDNYHFTKSYISYLAPALENSLNTQTGGFSNILEK